MPVCVPRPLEYGPGRVIDTTPYPQSTSSDGFPGSRCTALSQLDGGGPRSNLRVD